MNTLQDQLDEITANTRQLVQAERLAVSERSVEELFATGIEEKILPVGALAPEFALQDASGKLVRSQDMLALGPLVIKFFRGRWCPYCVTELEAWRDLYPQLRERGSAAGGHRPADRAAERLHGGPAPASLSCAFRPRLRSRRRSSAWLIPFPITCANTISLSSSIFPL